MALDLVIVSVNRKSDGSGYITLRPRDKLATLNSGLHNISFDSSPPDIVNLVGKEIWGGNNMVMLGQKKIAIRDGYTKFKFCVDNFGDWA